MSFQVLIRIREDPKAPIHTLDHHPAIRERRFKNCGEGLIVRLRPDCRLDNTDLVSANRVDAFLVDEECERLIADLFLAQYTIELVRTLLSVSPFEFLNCCVSGLAFSQEDRTNFLIYFTFLQFDEFWDGPEAIFYDREVTDIYTGSRVIPERK